MVSCATSKPDLSTSSATSAPAPPSTRISPVDTAITVAAATVSVIRQSFRLSRAVASCTEEEMRLPILRLNAHIHSFTSALSTITHNSGQPAVTSSGLISFCTELISNCPPANRIKNAMISEETYSTRPCPKGCSGSGCRPLRRALMMEISEEPMSERLLIASESTEMLPDSRPATILATHSSALSAMPTPPASWP